MKDCLYLDYEGVCGITCKECDGSINEICKYYHKGCCDLSGYTCTCGVGCAMFERCDNYPYTNYDLIRIIHDYLCNFMCESYDCCYCGHKNRCAMTAMSVTMILGGEY